ncbi:hypothetical protein ASF27_20715 [Methylobacterium sp. Leaf102]|nr:hypothetical protein ASF27_20715 [Methylobacterium sp. Leaf102]
MILAERAARLVSEITVERLKLEVARLRRERFRASSERSARIDQLELTLEDLEAKLCARNDAHLVWLAIEAGLIRPGVLHDHT